VRVRTTTKESGSESHKLRKLRELEQKIKNAKQRASWFTKSSATNGGNSENGVCVPLWKTVDMEENLHCTVN
jgi:hypothetical protein